MIQIEKNILWHKIPLNEVLAKLKTSFQGLSQEESQKRLKIFGPNKIIKKNKFFTFKIFLSQFTNFLIIILILSALIALMAGKSIEAGAIFFIIILNVFLGFFMELKAEKSILALKKMLLPTVRVIREEKEQILETHFLVPGDIIVLEEGNKIPADARLLETTGLEVNEAALTGESMPVIKSLEIKNENEKENLIFMGTIIAKGHGKAVVINTGMTTEFGKIAGMLGKVKEPLSPLQKQTIVLGKKIATIAFSIATFVLLFGIIAGRSLYEFLMTGLSLFVAVIPEGLLVVMTLALALGVLRMAQKKAVVRKLAAVETLGSTQIIATDKTGTLTKNEMVVKKIWINGKEIEIGEEKFDSKISSEIPLFLKIGILSNTAEVHLKKEGGFEILGDPTEASLLVLGEKAGFKEKEIKSKGKFLAEFPFDQVLRRRTIVFQEIKEIKAFTVGAPEIVLEISSKILKENQEIDITPEIYKEITQAIQSFALQGYRLLGLTYKNLSFQNSYQDREKIEESLVFVGLAIIYDPPRPEVKMVIKNCKEAGIRVLMITGDNELTALSVAKEIGLISFQESLDKKVVTGRQLDNMKEEEFFEIVDKINVFARTTPSHKLKIVETLQKKGGIVAVTGDGVNDAPALKEADIGAAMGITGTDVSKEASDIIIADDNFASIVNAVKEGRRIFDNVKRFIQFLLTANAIETPLIITAMFLGWPLPLNPLHILWINLVTDSAPAVTLSIEPSEKEIMKRKPRPSKESIFKGISSFILVGGILGFLGALAIFAFIYFLEGENNNLERARTMAFTFIVLFKLFLVFSCRSFKETIFQLGFLTNKKTIMAIGFSFFLQLMVIYHPFFQKFFQTTSLSFYDWAILLFLAIIGFILMELRKTLLVKNN